MNKKQRLDYESPTAELINLRVESGILTGSTNETYQKQQTWSYDDEWA